jgi:hypothetical protein
MNRVIKDVTTCRGVYLPIYSSDRIQPPSTAIELPVM